MSYPRQITCAVGSLSDWVRSNLDSLAWKAGRQIPPSLLCPTAGRLTVHTLICTIEVRPLNGTRRRKHGVQFSEAIGVFSDEAAITIKGDDNTNEERFVTLGVGLKGRILAVVYCWDDRIRIISARAAGRLEREQYEAQR